MAGGWQAAASLSRRRKADVSVHRRAGRQPEYGNQHLQHDLGDDNEAVGRLHASVRRGHVGHLRAPERTAAGVEFPVHRRTNHQDHRAEHRADRHDQPSADEPVEHALCEADASRQQDRAWRLASTSSTSSTRISSRHRVRAWVRATSSRAASSCRGFFRWA